MAVPPPVAKARDRPRPVALRHAHGIRRHLGDDTALALPGRLARRVDVHDETPDAAVGAELDPGVAPANAREPVDRVARNRVPAAHHALDRDRVAAEAGDEPVSFAGRGGAACEGRERDEDEASHGASHGGRSTPDAGSS
jgi:hypothetical protein